MSLTKQTSPDGVGGYDPDYEVWANSLPGISEDDLAAMAEEDRKRRERDEDGDNN